MAEAPHPREQFYGRRRGRPLRLGQRERRTTLLPRLSFVLPDSGGLDPSSLFALPREVWLEIGFGGGEHLASAAAGAPAADFLGCEPFVNGVAKTVARIARLGLANVRLHAGDATDLLTALPTASVDRIYLLYPDPWPKRRHRKRRFVSDGALAMMARVLKRGAELRFATDIDDYAAWTLARVARCPLFEWRAERSGDWLEPWPDWPGTRYEAKAKAQGRRPIYLTFVRSAAAP
jgi:tRNA (guanine-N7-)-methyltransferase